MWLVLYYSLKFIKWDKKVRFQKEDCVLSSIKKQDSKTSNRERVKKQKIKLRIEIIQQCGNIIPDTIGLVEDSKKHELLIWTKTT